MAQIIVEFGPPTTDSSQGVDNERIKALRSALESRKVAVEVNGIPHNEKHALVWYVAAWYAVKVVAKFVAKHDKTWDAVTAFIADVMDGHLKDGWVKIEVAADGTVTQTTHNNREHPDGSIVTIKEGTETVHDPEPGKEFTRDLFLASLREIVQALLP